MNYITVLDFEVGRVYQYEIEDKFNGDYEEYITSKGHNLKNCEWMIHENPQVITN